MDESLKPSTIYLDPAVDEALRTKAKSTNTSVSELVNEAVRLVLMEDQEDLAAFDERESESTMSHADLIEYLKANGKV